MNVIIRLQGLPWSASALDIRQYFQGLMIPEGGVHIVGGDLGDAFIAFGTDEDARQAMLMDSGKIKDSRVKLLLSSRNEMQKVIEMARSQSSTGQGSSSNQPIPNQPAINSGMTENMPQQQGRWGDARPDTNRRRERNSRERSRERDRTGRDRRRKSRSRSRTPRRSRDKDRDGKRKEDRDGRRSSERNRRDDTRKRDDKIGEIKRPPMGMMGPRPGGMMMPNSGPQMMPGGFGPFGPDRINMNPGFVPPRPDDRMGSEWRNHGTWSEPTEGPPSHGPTRQGFDNKDWDGPQQATEPFARGGRSRWSRDPPVAAADVRGAGGQEAIRAGEGRRIEGFGYDERRGNEGFGARDFNPERRGRGDGAFGMGRGRFGGGGDVNEPGGDRYGKGPPPPPMGRQGFEPRGGGRDSFGMEPNFAPMGEAYGPGDRRGREPYPADGGIDRRTGAYEAMSGGRGVRRGSDDFPPEGPRRVMDNDNRAMDYRGVSNGRPHDRFDDFTPSKRQASVGFCVEMTGMHYDVSRGDIYDFFRGLQVAHDGIKLFPNESGLRMTSALVRFTSETDRSEALKRNRQYLGSKCVEILPCSDNYFDKMGNNRYNRSNTETEYTTCIMIRGLPFNFKEDEIVDLFEGMKVVSVLMERTRSGDVTGIGFVEFDTVIDAKQAANSKKKIGHKYLELSLVGRERMVAARNTSEGKKDIIDRPSSPRMTSDCCLIQGLPFNATDRDIVEFFSGVNVMPVTIHIMLNKSSQPSGDAFCEFKSVQECEQALRKNKQCMGSRVIQVKAVSRKEMLDALGIPPRPTSASGSMRADRPPMRSSMDDRRPPIDRMMGEGRSGNGERGPLLESPNDWGMGGGLEGLPRGLQGFGKPGCVVGARNVPYRASIDEMLDFFRDYDLTKDSIIRRYNEKGQPTGEARISFRTPSDAQKAVRELNQQLIGGRSCSLFSV